MASVTISINSIVFRNLTDLKISPAKLGKVLIDSWYNQPNNNVLLLCNVVTLEEKINELKSEIIVLESKKELLQKFEDELYVQRQLLDQSREASEAFYTLQYLNKRIIYYKFNLETILKKHGDVVKQLQDYDQSFNIEEHVTRLKGLNSLI